jgi:regulator of RNase E activity RraA
MFSGRKEELSIDIPIGYGGIIVNPADFVEADEIGVTVIAAGEAAKVFGGSSGASSARARAPRVGCQRQDGRGPC